MVSQTASFKELAVFLDNEKCYNLIYQLLVDSKEI